MTSTFPVPVGKHDERRESRGMDWEQSLGALPRGRARSAGVAATVIASVVAHKRK